MEKCENCKFFDGSTAALVNPHSGTCRINPPVADDRTGVAVWPHPDPDDWCGKWVKDPNSADEDEE